LRNINRFSARVRAAGPPLSGSFRAPEQSGTTAHISHFIFRTRAMCARCPPPYYRLCPPP